MAGVVEPGAVVAELELLDRAARACRTGGWRLVLVVDGLDEDRSVTAGPYAHSIAGLLPARPPAEMGSLWQVGPTRRSPTTRRCPMISASISVAALREVVWEQQIADVALVPRADAVDV